MTAAHRFSSYFLRTFLFLLIVISVAFAALIPSFADGAESSESGLDVKISLNKDTYANGENAVITVSITNNTGKTLSNLSARYFIPDCFDLTANTTTEVKTLTPRQTVTMQIYAVTNTSVERIEITPTDNESDSQRIYIIIAAVVAVTFAGVTLIFRAKEKKRKKIAATIPFVFALVFAFSLTVIPSLGISASSKEPIYADNITYTDASSIIKKIAPEKASEILAELSPESPLTREKAALICALMLSGKNPIPEVSEKTFLDIPSDSFFKPYVEFCTKNDIISEISTGIFLPDEEVGGYEFLEYLLRAIGLGANGEYDTPDKTAIVATDALNLPHADLSSLLTGDTLTSSDALCHAVKLMLTSSAKPSARSEYELSAPSLISYFEGVTETKAVATNEKELFITENGKKLKLSSADAEQSSYTVTYFENSPIAVTPEMFTLADDCILLNAGGETKYLGVAVEYSSHAMKSDYCTLSGTFGASGEIFTSDNTHYVANSDAFSETKYVVGFDTVTKDNFDLSKSVVLITSYDSRSLTYSLSGVAYAYQTGTVEKANYDSYNTSLSSAKAISNGQKTYMQSAYDEFLSTINDIDTSLRKDLIDTEKSKKAILISQNAIEKAVAELEKNRIVSYAALDEQIKLAEVLISSEGDYTEESFALFKEAYANATAVSRDLLDTEKNCALIKSLEAKLSQAMASLEMSKYCNYTDYYAALARAKAITNNTGKYTASQFSSFKKKISSIDNGLNKKLTRSEKNQQKIDKACENILKAISNLNYNIPCDYSQLDAAIEIALTYDNSDYRWTSSSFSAFQDALKAAKKVERNMTVGYGSTNQDIITSAATYLTESIKNLKKNKVCDYSAYNKAFKEASAVTNDEGLYGEVEFKLFKDTLTAIDEGLPKDLYRADETNALIAKAVSDIARAIELLKEPTKCDYTELDKALRLAEETKKEGKEYTADSLNVLAQAIEGAKSVEREFLTDALGSRQSAIDKAAEDINAAIEALVIQETFSTEILAVTEKTVTVNKEKVVQKYIKISHGDKEEEVLLPESIGIVPEVGDKVTISIADKTVTALTLLPSEPAGSDPA